MRYFVTLPGCDEIAVDVVQRPGGQREVLVDGQPVAVSAVNTDGALNVLVDGHVIDLWAADEGDAVRYATRLERALASVESERSRLGAAASRRGHSAGGGAVLAPMPGRVVKLLVAVGDAVQAGSPVVVVEAMKMENELCSERVGLVKAILVAPGDTVDSGALLVELGPVNEAESGAEPGPAAETVAATEVS